MPHTTAFDNEIRYIPVSGISGYVEAVCRRRCCRLLFISDGIVFCTLNGKKRQFGQGDVIFLRKNDELNFFSRSGADTRVCALIFGEGVLADISAFLESDGFFAAGSKEPPVVRLRGIQRNKTERDMMLPASADAADKGLLRMIAAQVLYECFVIRTELPEWLETPPDWFVEYYMLLSRHYIFTKPFNEIIALAGKSREYISRLFKSATGKNISDYVVDLRINYACNLLKNSSMDVMEISFECGFDNLSTFYHHFSPRVGMPPKRYRDSVRRQRGE